MSRIIAVLRRKIAVHRRKIAVMSRTAAVNRRKIAVKSRIYCDYFGARHLIGDDYTAILLLLRNGFRRFSDCSTAIFFNRVVAEM